MRKLVEFLLFTLLLGCFAQAAGTVTFFQEATTKKEGPPPQPGVVGQPGKAPSENLPGGLPQIPAPSPTARPADSRTSPGGDVTVTRGTAQTPSPARSPGADSSVRVARTDSARGSALIFRDAPIETVISTIMRELGYSYVIDPQVSGTVNIYTSGEIPRDKLFGVLEQLLKMNGNAIIRQDDFYVIVPMGQSPATPHSVLVKPEERSKGMESPHQEGQPPLEPPVQEGEPSPPPEAEAEPEQEPEQESRIEARNRQIAFEREQAIQEIEGEQGVITYIIPLHHIPSSDMLTMAQAFVSGGATVVDFQPANTLIITDFRRNIQQVLKLVEILDTRYFDMNAIELIPIRFNNASDIAEDLGKIFAPGDTAAGVRIVAIERLNSLLIVTRAAAVFDEVQRWIARLDAPSTTSNVKTYVYQVENNTAVQIAQILSELYQDGSGLPSGPVDPDGNGPVSRLQQQQRMPTQQAGFVPGSTLDGQGGLGGFGRGGRSGFGGASPFGSAAIGPSLSNATRSEIRSVVAGNVKIVVNEFNNSLIIQGTEADIQFLLETVRQLDTLPRQVLIEARIFSVELRDELSFGVSAFLQRRGSGVPGDGNGNGTTGSGGLPATTGRIASSGQLTIISRAVLGDERELQGILNALRAETKVEIIESPRLLAMDGTPASINVGAEVPVTTASFGDPLRSSDLSFINSVQFRPTGTTLLFVPRISASGIVNLDLAVEVSSVASGATSLTPTISRNFVQTTLIVRDGQTVALGGLISDQHSLGKSRVPLLGDIPILGAVFGQTTRNDRRSELVIFITPHVITTMPTAA
ncbi:MAG TPA: secretin N-terminal domain-containing protein, partial [Acidobacteriota bacterium]|nr:secretin N-terminal domain-containing protein [Acidobacteriota bacterium]